MKFILFFCIILLPNFITVSAVSGSELVNGKPSKDYYFSKTNIILASLYESKKTSKPDDFFKYYRLKGDYYLRVAYEYYGNLSRGYSFDIDELGKAILFREVSKQDWNIIFLKEQKDSMVLNGCDIYPLVYFPSSVLKNGRNAIIDFIESHQTLGRLCEQISNQSTN